MLEERISAWYTRPKCLLLLMIQLVFNETCGIEAIERSKAFWTSSVHENTCGLEQHDKCEDSGHGDVRDLKTSSSVLSFASFCRVRAVIYFIFHCIHFCWKAR